jgi:hypothetical protein
MEMMHLPPPDSRLRARTCIIVAGTHRSGTSAITRVVNLLGADITEDLLPPVAGNNDRGFWEPIRVVDIHDRLLQALESSYDDPFPLPEYWMQTKAAQRAMCELSQEIQKDFSEHHLFVVKDPRISRLLPLWLKLLDSMAIEPIIIIPVRNPLETAASLKKRDQFSLAKSFLIYLRSNLETELASRGRRRLFVSYNQLLCDWSSFAVKLGKLADGHVPSIRAESIIEINDFLSADLYRNRFTRGQLCSAVDIPAVVVEVFERMSNVANTGDEYQLDQAFDRLREEVADATKLFHGLFIWEQERACEQLARLQEEQETARQALISEVAEIRREIIFANDKSNDLHVALTTRSAETARLNEELSAAHFRVGALDSARSELLTEVTRLGDELSESQRQISTLNSKLASQSFETTRLSHELSISQTQNLSLNALFEAHSVQASEMRSAFEENRKVLGELRAELADTRRRAGDLTVSLDSSTRELQAIKLTPAWRLMGPSRWIRARLQRYSNLKLIDESCLFDRGWYLAHYPDVGNHGVDPALHYLRYGAKEGRDPCPLFDSNWYLHENPDVLAAGINPLVHYLRYGAAEGRDPNPLFDSDWYVDKHPSISRPLNPFRHYLQVGWLKGYDPHPWFDSSWYLERYSDVALTKSNPLYHYMTTGAAEGRDPHPQFDTNWYLNTYVEVGEAGRNPLVHYVTVGIEAGHQTNGSA